VKIRGQVFLSVTEFIQRAQSALGKSLRLAGCDPADRVRSVAVLDRADALAEAPQADAARRPRRPRTACGKRGLIVNNEAHKPTKRPQITLK